MKYRIMFLLFCIILSGCTSVSDVFSGTRYCYSVEIFNATPNARLRVERFYVYKDFEMSSGFHPLWSGGRCGVSSFFSEPYPNITLNWIIVKGDKSEKKYSKIVAMNIPKQFTQKSGSEISFIFYEAEVLVVYEYYISRDITNHTSETKYVLSGDIPYIQGDFQKYMKANPLATTEDFLKYQKKKYAK